MCNLYRLKVSRWELVSYYQANDDWRREVELEKDYVAPGRPGLVIRHETGARVVDEMTWGWPNPRGGRPVVNVRNYASPFWRSALADPGRRCLVPFTQFQEWSTAPDPATGRKRAYDFDLPSRPIGTFAGIWRPSEIGPIYAFLTCEPNSLVGAIHPKAMPVILADEDFNRWLNAPVDEALALAQPFPAQLMAIV